MKKGFTVIEIVLAIFLATLLSLSLFQLLNQARKAVKRITTVIEVDTPLIAFYNQVQKDVTGMFAPASSLDYYTEKEAEAKKEKEQEKFPGSPKKKEEASKPKTKQIERVFDLEVRPDYFFWSFITTGGIQQLDSDGVSAPVPLIRRVAYLLEPDTQRSGLYKLVYRFSGTVLELEPFKSAQFSPSYELIHGIRSISIELTLFEEAPADEATPKSGQDTKKQEQKSSSKSVKQVSLKEWKVDEIWAKYKTLIPAFVKLSGIRVDTSGREYPFEMCFKVYAYNPLVKKEKSLFEALEDIAKQIWKKA